MNGLSEQGAKELFKTVLQHMKCIEIRIEFAKGYTTQKQKYALSNAIRKVEGAINHICDLLPNSDAVLQVKKDLDKSELVYVMVFTEQLMRGNEDDLEHIATMIEDYMDNKYGKNKVQCQSLESTGTLDQGKIQ